MSDYYSVLGVGRDADDAEIKKAYRKMAQKYHPDRNAGDKKAEAKFKEVQEAYEALSNPQKRKMYDQFGTTGGPGGAQGFPGGTSFDFNEFGGFADIFESFFGQGGSSGAGPRKMGPQRGGDIETHIDVSFEEAIFGSVKHLELTKPDRCDHCVGNGLEPGHSMKECADCDGQGSIQMTRQTILGQIASRQVCPNCRGSGRVPEKVCTQCHGEMRVNKTSEVSIKIPEGIEDGTTIRLKEKGSAGLRGGAYGDLFARIHVKPHPRFSREGKTIYSDEEIPLMTAVLGGKVKVDTVHGKEELKVPAGTQGGTEFTLKSKGSPTLRSDKRGDHKVTVQVRIPKKLSRKERGLFEELADLGGVDVD